VIDCKNDEDPIVVVITDLEAVQITVKDLSVSDIIFDSSETSTGVGNDFTLPLTGANSTTISWASNNGAVVVGGASATVNRPQYGQPAITVTLTATVSRGAESSTKNLTITVIPPYPGELFLYQAGSEIIRLRFVPALAYINGVDDLGANVTPAGDFLIAETEVSYRLWKAVYDWATTDAGGGVRADGGPLYTIVNPGRQGGDANACCTGVGTDQHPVSNINWRDAIVWANALTEYLAAQSGQTLQCVYTSDAAFTTPLRVSTNGAINTTAGAIDNPYVNTTANGFRLPDSIEWELAARFRADLNADGDIKDANEYYFGNSPSGSLSNSSSFTATDAVAWFGNSTVVGTGNTVTTQVVGQKNSNGAGLYDVSGNLFEWVFDWKVANTTREIRGGSWQHTHLLLQVGNMGALDPSLFDSTTGFRVVRIY